LVGSEEREDVFWRSGGVFVTLIDCE